MASTKQQIGASLLASLRATIIGGLLFLFPMVLIIIVFGYAMQFSIKIAKPISEILHVEPVLGAGGVTVLAALVLILLSLLAGLVARTNAGKRIMRWFENSILGGLPQYRLVKSMAEGLVQVETTEGVHPALVSIEGGWQIAYLLEQLENGWVTVFLPQAPTPMSGNVMYMPADRVRPLNITMVEAMTIVRRIGVGSAKALRGSQLKLPDDEH